MNNPWMSPCNTQTYPPTAIQNSCMTPQSALPPGFMNMPPPPGSHTHNASLPPLSAHAQHVTSAPAAAAMAAGIGCGTLPDTYHDTDIRNTSIAALRLKAREHSAAMELFSAYGHIK